MFKNWTWKQWTALGNIAAVVIAAVVCHAWLEVVAVATFALGVGTGCLLMKKPSSNSEQDKTNKQLLLD